VPAGSLVLDYRCVMAAAWPYTRLDQRGRAGRQPYSSVGELAEVERAGIGRFTAAELDVLRGVLSVDAMPETSSTWGRPERVFDKLVPDVSRALRVKSALHIGPGSTIRLRNLQTGAVEYGLVMASTVERATVDLLLPTVFRLELLLPVSQEFPATDTVIEPLVPSPVNVNTASEAVLTAICEQVAISPRAHLHGASGAERPVSRAEAREFAAQIVALRSGDARIPGQGPFTGWQDFAERMFRPRLEGARNFDERWAWLYLYRNLRTGRDSFLEMGTAPVCFRSGPLVGYRAAASRSRSTVAPGVAARHERTGLAAAIPGFRLEHAWRTQDVFEDAFVLDRRAPFWLTTPVNVGAVLPGEATNDPTTRAFSHVWPMAFANLGLGVPRFPVDDPADAGIAPTPASANGQAWAGQDRTDFPNPETFAQALDPRGRDLVREGPYELRNTGPTGGAGGAQAGGGRHDQVSFPFSNDRGFMRRFATSFWLQPQTLEGTTLFDHGDGNPDRNRLAVHGRDGQLVFEVIDEAGLDPDPSASPAGVDRTAAEWKLPLAELGLPSDTPVHVNVSAYGNRPSDLSFAVDGMTRGKGKFVTYLTAPLPPFDPSQASNAANPPGQPGSDRYLDVQVESTEGFPPVGILQIGLELFEYSGVTGNGFQCTWRDSLGGRGARQDGAEFMPAIPVDGNGKPTIDIAQLAQQGLNLAVFPAHPAGSAVQLYGYSALLSEDSPMMVGTTRLSGSVGGFAVARGYINNPRDISMPLPNGSSLRIGTGIDPTWSGELLLADPVPTGKTQPPAAAQEGIANAFSPTGGYALLMQIRRPYQGQAGAGQPSGTTTNVGGIEVIKYGARDGNKLTGVQRAQSLPGKDAQLPSWMGYQPGAAE
jgi:hypothetical protein